MENPYSWARGGRMLFQVFPFGGALGLAQGIKAPCFTQGQLQERLKYHPGPLSSPLSGTSAHFLGPGREYYKEVEIPCASPNAPPNRGKLEITFDHHGPTNKRFPSKPRIASALPASWAGPTETVVARSVGSKCCSLGNDHPCSVCL